ncbi:MAG TPA: hypothetical protein VGJ70_02260 [Solirubrobacteraceae bacterium]
MRRAVVFARLPCVAPRFAVVFRARVPAAFFAAVLRFVCAV